MEKKPVALFFMLLVILAAQETMVQTEARICKAPSGQYHGACLYNTGCASVCKNVEGLLGGQCNGKFQCICSRNC
ncbi:defensin-like protein [Quillaja saponaria]|uniref:Defensin-like protein n=1 Tax=Quillaja saponaria TaxID=32244 RepID=A0AAD7LAI8_QUISA|nr:defensin-like protein [Quillaja saponaria]